MDIFVLGIKNHIRQILVSTVFFSYILIRGVKAVELFVLLCSLDKFIAYMGTPYIQVCYTGRLYCMISTVRKRT